jgi:hypothetical protein
LKNNRAAYNEIEERENAIKFLLEERRALQPDQRPIITPVRR